MPRGVSVAAQYSINVCGLIIQNILKSSKITIFENKAENQGNPQVGNILRVWSCIEKNCPSIQGRQLNFLTIDLTQVPIKQNN